MQSERDIGQFPVLVTKFRPKPSRLRLFCFDDTNEILERRSCYDAIELGSVIVDQTNVFDHQVVHFPLVVYAMKFVIDG